jgi:hypothetical protein
MNAKLQRSDGQPFCRWQSLFFPACRPYPHPRVGPVSGRSGFALVDTEEEQRGTRRRVLNLSALAREADLNLLQIQVLDISTDGCRIAGDINLEQATRIWLKIPGITLRAARITWSRAGEAGCAFEDPIPIELVEDVSRSVRRPAHELRLVFGRG